MSSADSSDQLDETLASFEAFARLNNGLVSMNILANHRYNLQRAKAAFSSYCAPLRLPAATAVYWRLVVLPSLHFTASLDLHSSPRLLGDPPVGSPARSKFSDTFRRAQLEGRPMFLYFFPPGIPGKDAFFKDVLFSEIVKPFLSEKFVLWSGSPLNEEGLIVSYRFQVSRFPCCLVILPLLSNSLVIVSEIRCSKHPEELLRILYQVEEETSKARSAIINEAEERREKIRWFEFHAIVDEYQNKVNDANVRRLRKEEAAEREAEMQARVNLLRDEPQNRSDAIQVAVRFPFGKRVVKGFHKSETIKSLYDFVDSFNLGPLVYTIVSIRQHRSFGREMHNVTLEEAGLDLETLYVKMDKEWNPPST